MKRNNRLGLEYIVFLAVILLATGFSYWLFVETEAERAQRFHRGYEFLLLQNKTDQAGQLFSEALYDENGTPLNEIWLPLVVMQQDGYGKLINYTRILAGNVNREATYEEISNLIKNAPSEFHNELKSHYFTEILEIPRVRKEFLIKYDLIGGL